MNDLAASLIDQLQMRAALVGACARSNGEPSTIESLQAIVLRHGVGRFCTANRWRGVRRGRLKECFTNATHTVLREPKRYVYMEGYAVRPSLGIVVGEHAWVLDAENDYAVIDPTWRDTKGSVYLGIPFRSEYLIEQIMEHKVYGLLDAYVARWPMRRLPPSVWLHEDAAEMPRDFVVPEGDSYAAMVAQMAAK